MSNSIFTKLSTIPKFFLVSIVLYILTFSASAFSFDIVDKDGSVVKNNISVKKKSGILYVSKEELVKSLLLSEIDENSFYLKKDIIITFLKNNSYFSINNKIFNLSYNTFIPNDFVESGKEDSDLFIPLKSFAEILNKYIRYDIIYLTNESIVVNIGGTLSEDRTPKSLSSKQSNILKVEVDEKSNGILIKIHTNKMFKTDDVSSYISGDNHLNLTLYQSKIDTTFFGSDYDLYSNKIKKLIPIQFDESSQLTFILKRDIEVISKSISVRNNLIMVNLFLKKINEMGNDDIKERLLSSKNRWKIDRIIIDAGHGGKDPGAIGYKGIKEKDVTLGIAKFLEQLLREDKYLKVFMTRNSDVFTPLKERTKFANDNNGKLFVSIHCNAVKQKRVSGFETYFLSPARTEKAMKVAAKENAAIKYESNFNDYKRLTDDDFIILTMVQDNFAKESEKWASIVQDEIDRVSYTENRGVDQAGFYVLIGASMPSILVEAGFISNPKEEKLLKSKLYQRKIARAIYNSIINLRNEIGD